MALDLNEYIKQSYERPNRKVLEGLGASEDLIEYLMETPGNTNWNIINNIGSTDDQKYIIKLAKTGAGAEIYAADSPQKPTYESFYAKFMSTILPTLNQMGYSSLEEVPSEEMGEVMMTLIPIVDNEIIVYSLKGSQLHCLIEGWVDVTIEEYMSGIYPTEMFMLDKNQNTLVYSVEEVPLVNN